MNRKNDDLAKSTLAKTLVVGIAVIIILVGIWAGNYVMIQLSPPDHVMAIERIASLKDPTAKWAQIFSIEASGGKIYFSSTQGHKAGYAGAGGIYNIDPESLNVSLVFPYSAAGAWWANSPAVPSLGGSWGHLSDGENVYFGGYAINDINGDLISLKDETVYLLPDHTHEVWSLAKIGTTIYAATSFSIYTSTDLRVWTKLPGTDRRVNISENVIWGMVVYNDTLYCVSNFLYRYDAAQAQLTELYYNNETNTLKPICIWNGTLWFSGFASSLNQNYTWLMSYDPITGRIEKVKVPANSIVDIIPYANNLWLAGYTEPRVFGEYLHGNKGVLFRFDGEALQKVVELDLSGGFVGIAGYDDYIYVGTFTGDIYRLHVPTNPK